MSPEQAKGKPTDKRSDIWAFGCVLYEMLAGKRAFPGDSAMEILAGVLNNEPDLSAAAPRVRNLLRWCLEKDRKNRLRDIGDARRLLDEADFAALPAGTSRRPLAGWGVAVIAFIALVGLGFVPFREVSTEPTETRLDIVTPSSSNAYGFAIASGK